MAATPANLLTKSKFQGAGGVMKVLIDVALVLLRVVFLVASFFAWGPQMNSSDGPLGNPCSQIPQQRDSLSNSYQTAAQKPVHELIEAWCSAYSEMNARQMTSLEGNETEIVDGFGESHYLQSREKSESFWSDGFELIEPRHFHPQCAFQHMQTLDTEAAVVQVKVKYPQGIELKGGERIARFAELHTFIVTKDHQKWLISGHIVVRQQQED
jgi:hypothetical protein